jgi:hypothetical protein
MGLDDRAHPQGELGRARDYTMSVEEVRNCPLDPPFSPKAGNVKVGIAVVIEGASTAEVPVNPFYASLTDESGESYSSTLAGCSPGLPSIRVTTGTKASGYVTFEIPKTSRRLELRYAPIVIGAGPEPLRFALTR